jgi:hypothetical protein
VESELRRRFHQGLIFVSDMGDLWGEWVPNEWIKKVLKAVEQSPDATFLFLTKNPVRYYEFLHQMPDKVVLGTTIESNRQLVGTSKAPPVFWRAWAMTHLDFRPKMVSIEPILDFDMEPFVRMIQLIHPEFVYCGMDNWNHHLPEPTLEKTQLLITELRKFTEVREKTIRRAWYES